MSQPRLLVVSPRFLFPLDQGGRIRTANTLRHMKGGTFHITLASPAPADAARFAAQTVGVCDRFLSWPEPKLSALGKMAAFLGRLPVSVAGDGCERGRAVVASALAEQPDAVLVDFPHAAVLLPAAVRRPSILFTHNVETEIFARHASVARGLKRLAWRDQTRKMQRFEEQTLRAFDRVIAVSERDAAALRSSFGLKRVEAIETGVDTDYYDFRLRPGPPPDDGGTVVFTGSMDSRSNIDGIEFLMQEIWPLVLRKRPAARAVIAGRNPPERLAAAAKARGFDWSFTGFVDDVRPSVAEADVYVIPLRVGSGTRIKVFEAMAMGAPVVSTRLGAEGLDVTPGEHLLMADLAADFAEAILRLLDDSALASRIALAAREAVAARFSWPHVTRRFERICADAMQAPAPAQAESSPAFSSTVST